MKRLQVSEPTKRSFPFKDMKESTGLHSVKVSRTFAFFVSEQALKQANSKQPEHLVQCFGWLW